MALGPECCWTLTEGHEQLDRRILCWSIKLSTREFWDKFWLNVSVPHSNTAVSPRSLSLEKFLSHETSLAARREEVRLYLHADHWRFFRFCSAVFIEFSVFPYFLASSGFELKDLFPPTPPPLPSPHTHTQVWPQSWMWPLKTDDVICGTKDVIP